MNIFIAGFPGCGKSTLIFQLIKELKQKRIAGIITPELRKDGRKGFLIKDIASGKQEILASTDIKGPRVSKYHVNIQGTNKIVKKAEKSFDKAEVIFIDEIGKMEFFSEEFKKMLDILLKSQKTIIATLHQSYINKYKNKGILIWLEKSKMKEVKSKIVGMIK